MAERKLIHFIPCVTNVDAEYTDGVDRVDAWGLYDDGSTEALVSDAEGRLVAASKLDGFIRLSGNE